MLVIDAKCRCRKPWKEKLIQNAGPTKKNGSRGMRLSCLHLLMPSLHVSFATRLLPFAKNITSEDTMRQNMASSKTRILLGQRCERIKLKHWRLDMHTATKYLSGHSPSSRGLQVRPLKQHGFLPVTTNHLRTQRFLRKWWWLFWRSWLQISQWMEWLPQWNKCRSQRGQLPDA